MFRIWQVLHFRYLLLLTKEQGSQLVNIDESKQTKKLTEASLKDNLGEGFSFFPLGRSLKLVAILHSHETANLSNHVLFPRPVRLCT